MAQKTLQHEICRKTLLMLKGMRGEGNEKMIIEKYQKTLKILIWRVTNRLMIEHVKKTQ